MNTDVKPAVLLPAFAATDVDEATPTRGKELIQALFDFVVVHLGRVQRPAVSRRRHGAST